METLNSFPLATSIFLNVHFLSHKTSKMTFDKPSSRTLSLLRLHKHGLGFLSSGKAKQSFFTPVVILADSAAMCVIKKGEETQKGHLYRILALAREPERHGGNALVIV
jgi:hypothetical protein